MTHLFVYEFFIWKWFMTHKKLQKWHSLGCASVKGICRSLWTRLVRFPEASLLPVVSGYSEQLAEDGREARPVPVLVPVPRAGQAQWSRGVRPAQGRPPQKGLLFISCKLTLEVSPFLREPVQGVM